MKMGFLLKNNARKGMGREGALKKGEEKEAQKGEKKECSKRERKRRQKKRPPKFANSKTDGRLGGNSQILKAGGSSVLKLLDWPRCSHNVNKSE